MNLTYDQMKCNFVIVILATLGLGSSWLCYINKTKALSRFLFLGPTPRYEVPFAGSVPLQQSHKGEG